MNQQATHPPPMLLIRWWLLAESGRCPLWRAAKFWISISVSVSPSAALLFHYDESVWTPPHPSRGERVGVAAKRLPRRSYSATVWIIKLCSGMALLWNCWRNFFFSFFFPECRGYRQEIKTNQNEREAKKMSQRTNYPHSVALQDH